MSVSDYIHAYRRGDIMPTFDTMYQTMRTALERSYGCERRHAILMHKFGAVYPHFKKRRKPIWIIIQDDNDEKKIIRFMLNRTSRAHIYEKSTNASWSDYNGEPYVLIRFDAKSMRIDRLKMFYRNIRVWIGLEPFARTLSYEKRKTDILIDPTKYRLFVVSNTKPRLFKELFKIKVVSN